MAAHFALLLPNFEIIWFLQGWSDHALAGIGKFINEDHRAWLEWPLDQARKLREARENGMANVEGLTPEE